MRSPLWSRAHARASRSLRSLIEHEVVPLYGATRSRRPGPPPITPEFDLDDLNGEYRADDGSKGSERRGPKQKDAFPLGLEEYVENRALRSREPRPENGQDRHCAYAERHNAREGPHALPHSTAVRETFLSGRVPLFPIQMSRRRPYRGWPGHLRSWPGHLDDPRKPRNFRALAVARGVLGPTPLGHAAFRIGRSPREVTVLVDEVHATFAVERVVRASVLRVVRTDASSSSKRPSFGATTRSACSPSARAMATASYVSVRARRDVGPCIPSAFHLPLRCRDEATKSFPSQRSSARNSCTSCHVRS